MGWKSVDPMLKIQELKEPLEGYLQEIRQVRLPDKLKPGTERISYLYTMETEEGPVKFWGTTVFDRRVAELMRRLRISAEEGEESIRLDPAPKVRITYLGKAGPAYNFALDYDPDDWKGRASGDMETEDEPPF